MFGALNPKLSILQIFQLERELAEAQRAAGLPVLVPSPGTPHSAEESLKKDSLASEIFIAKTTSPVVQSARPFQGKCMCVIMSVCDFKEQMWLTKFYMHHH